MNSELPVQLLGFNSQARSVYLPVTTDYPAALAAPVL